MSLSVLEKKEIRGILRSNDYYSYRNLMDRLRDDAVLTNDVLTYLTIEFVNKLNIENYSASIVLKCSNVIKEIIERKMFDYSNIERDTLGRLLNSKILFEQLKKAKNLSCIELEQNINIFYNVAQSLLNKYDNTTKEERKFLEEKEKLNTTIKELEEELKQTKERIYSLENGLKKQQLKNEQREKDNASLRKEISDLKQKESSLAKEKNDFSIKSEELEGATEKILKEKEKMQEKLHSLEEKFRALTTQHSSQENLLVEKEELLKEKEQLLKAKEQEKEQLDQDNQKIIQGLKKELLELRKKETQKNILESSDSLIKESAKEKILQCLLMKLSDKKAYSLEELTTFLNSQGYRIDQKDVYRLLRKLKIRFNIIERYETIPSVYQLCSLDTTKINQRTIKCSKENGMMSFLIIADTHMEKIDTDVLQVFDEVYNYCEMMGIRHILHLGDFFHFLNNDSIDIEYSSSENLLIEEASKLLPSSPSITMSILGGNHDKNPHSKGLKTIERLSRMRSDYHFLGYDHAKLNLDTETASNPLFMLHHSNKRLLLQDKKGNYDVNELLKKRDVFYENLKCQEKNYVDLCGHFHASYFDKNEMICCCPSLFKDRFENGAWLVKVYLENNCISYMVFTELKLNKTLEEKKDYVLARRM